MYLMTAGILRAVRFAQFLKVISFNVVNTGKETAVNWLGPVTFKYNVSACGKERDDSSGVVPHDMAPALRTGVDTLVSAPQVKIPRPPVLKAGTDTLVSTLQPLI